MAGRAQGYTDYYKQNSTAPDDNENSNLTGPSPVKTTMPTTQKMRDAAERRKAAIRRRLASKRKTV